VASALFALVTAASSEATCCACWSEDPPAELPADPEDPDDPDDPEDPDDPDDEVDGDGEEALLDAAVVRAAVSWFWTLASPDWAVSTPVCAVPTAPMADRHAVSSAEVLEPSTPSHALVSAVIALAAAA
jgi:hypothetical protein